MVSTLFVNMFVGSCCGVDVVVYLPFVCSTVFLRVKQPEEEEEDIFSTLAWSYASFFEEKIVFGKFLIPYR